VSRPEYLGLEGVNWSVLKAMAVSPRAYRHALTATREPTEAMRMGTALHALVLQAERPDLVRVWRGGQRRGKEWEAFRDAPAPQGAVILNEREEGVVLAMLAALREHPLAWAVLSASGDREVPVGWTDAETRLRCRALPDLVTEEGALDGLGLGVPVGARVVVDLKTTATPLERFPKESARRMYHGQLAHYCAGTGCKVGALVVVESSEPHDVGVFVLDDDALWSGEVLVSRLLARVAECEASGEWSGAMPYAEVLSLPAWAAEDHDDDDDNRQEGA
jgi:hypothetical protein